MDFLRACGDKIFVAGFDGVDNPYRIPESDIVLDNGFLMNLLIFHAFQVCFFKIGAFLSFVESPKLLIFSDANWSATTSEDFEELHESMTRE
jgi:hypothetical protein